jgi:hypothetical protein
MQADVIWRGDDPFLPIISSTSFSTRHLLSISQVQTRLFAPAVVVLFFFGNLVERGCNWLRSKVKNWKNVKVIGNKRGSTSYGKRGVPKIPEVSEHPLRSSKGFQD